MNFFKNLLLKYKINPQKNGIKFCIAETLKEKEEVYKLRYDIYCKEKKYLKEEDYPECMEYDCFDKMATHFIAINKLDKKIVGSLRLIPKKNNSFNTKKIPLENYTNINNYISINDYIGELSRFVIDRKFRKKKSINFGLVKNAVLFSLTEGMTHFVISISIKRKHYFEEFGFEQIGEEYVYKKIKYKLPSITMLANIQKTLKEMKKININFYNYFTKK